MQAQTGFGGGCHWCTEAVFQGIRGVTLVKQGWIASRPPDDIFSEAVIVHYAPKVIPLDILIEIHLLTHASQQNHSMRRKYRSAIYARNASQLVLAKQRLEVVAKGFDKPVVTRVLPLAVFKPSDEAYQNYYRTDPMRPFCRTHIEPKLQKIRTEYTNYAATAPRKP
ncbi:MAG: peptide-methionine (S)-S-oxide reductase [Pseudomonadota bacterium]